MGAQQRPTNPFSDPTLAGRNRIQPTPQQIQPSQPITSLPDRNPIQNQPQPTRKPPSALALALFGRGSSEETQDASLRGQSVSSGGVNEKVGKKTQTFFSELERRRQEEEEEAQKRILEAQLLKKAKEEQE